SKRDWSSDVCSSDLGIDCDPAAVAYAKERDYIACGAAADFDELIAGADYVVFALYPTAFLAWIREHGCKLRPGTLVTDVSGVKRSEERRVGEEGRLK